MKLTISLALVLTACLLFTNSTKAAFPQDFSDVVFIEAPYVKDWPIGSRLNVDISGGNINLRYDRANSWPAVRPNSLGGAAVNANAWGFVKLGGVWHAGTWEYLRPGQITKKTTAFGGCCHFRSPINNFNKVNGEIYGFMVAGVTRDTSGGINVAQRTNVELYRWGSGVVPYDPGNPGGVTEQEPVVPSAAINLLLAPEEVTGAE
ncbi:hypothetical protein [Arenicella xantha]|uniref:Uncharacterized protein n=1 Tax=Arenicella xantha TaxID=644221 RepID=A0A395JI04_9GAMM|nr:hypothetical protein [Arenicella xantha]RBP49209.1 hypothetical protein DFR28_104137 [Arenicella xantha]